MSNRQNASLYTLNFTLNTSPIITGAKCITKKFNKRKHADQISAALQFSRCCGRQLPQTLSDHLTILENAIADVGY